MAAIPGPQTPYRGMAKQPYLPMRVHHGVRSYSRQRRHLVSRRERASNAAEPRSVVTLIGLKKTS